MGRLQAEEMARLADPDVALRWHLQSNHYPPVPLAMLPVAKQAIEHGNAEEWDTQIELPEGVEHRVHGRKVPASAVIEELHLDAFLGNDVLDS